MNVDLSEEATEFGRQALRAFHGAGGDQLLQDAERDSASRQLVVESILHNLGAFELEPYREPVEMEAAAALCRSAGYYAIPYPVAELLARPTPQAQGLSVVATSEPEAPVADLIFTTWLTVNLDGDWGTASARPASPQPTRETLLVRRLDVRPDAALGGNREIALALALPCWTLLGMLDRAVDLTREHVLIREQFDRPLSQFQSVQFQLVEAEVQRRGVEMLARYAIWAVDGESGDDALDSALALRLAAIEASDIVFRVAHQLHGAAGFCDESPLSWISRYSLPLRRSPIARSGTVDLLARRTDRRGLAGLFSGSAGA